MCCLRSRSDPYRHLPLYSDTRGARCSCCRDERKFAFHPSQKTCRVPSRVHVPARAKSALVRRTRRLGEPASCSYTKYVSSPTAKATEDPSRSTAREGIPDRRFLRVRSCLRKFRCGTE